jgi:hypothetical protein
MNHKDLSGANQSATPAYASDLTAFLPLTGGTLSGNLIVNNHISIKGFH